MDKAQEANEEHRADAIAAHFRRGIRNARLKALETCKDCGKEIPEARRQAVPGCERCVQCQTDFEILENWR